MRSLTNFEQVHLALAGFISTSPTEKRYSLDRMYQLMNFLNNPQNNLRIIHVAGTSGKTSTSYYCAALLQQAGFTTGLTVSPHIDEVNERAQINLHGLSEGEYCQQLSLFLDIIDKSLIKPSYFELLIGFAYWLFDKYRVDYAIVEVGLGGLLDGTNVINRTDKICIITDIGLDHTEVLGDTITKIATQKAGIIHDDNPVFMNYQTVEVNRVISIASKKHMAHLTILNAIPKELKDNDNYKNLPAFQQRNLQLAFTATESITKKFLDQEALTRAIETVIPARMETIAWNDKIVILDGSHNEQKLTVLRDAINKKYGSTPRVLLISFGQNKHSYLKETIAILAGISRNLYITKFSTAQDQIRSAIEPSVISAEAPPKAFDHIVDEADPVKAWSLVSKKPEKIIIVTGSFYLLNDIRPIVIARKN